jgi:hypothetical protein
MSVVWYRARADFRRRPRSTLLLVLLVAVVTAAALAGAAGARRTTSSYDRLVASHRSFDVLVNPDQGIASELDVDAVRRLPQVEHLGIGYGTLTLPEATGGGPEFFEHDALVLAAGDGELFQTVELPKMVSGRLPDPDAVDEVLVNPQFVENHGVGVGDDMTVYVAGAEELFAFEGDDPSEFPFEPVEVTVTGVAVMSDELVEDDLFESERLLLTRAFDEAHPESRYFYGLFVTLRGGADDIAAFRAAVDELAPPGEEIVYQTRPQIDGVAHRALRPGSVALWLFAIVVALAGALIVGQALSREVAADGRDMSGLQSMGVTRRERLVTAGLRTSLVVVAGVVLGALGAIALSPLAPVGLARDFEPLPGLDVDWTVLGIGMLAIILVLGAAVGVGAWQTARVRTASAPSRPSVLVEALARRGAPVTAVAGTRFAYDAGQGERRVPVRSTLISAAVAVTAVVAAITFAASLGHLLDTPRLYGWNWDTLVEVREEDVDEDQMRAAGDALVESGAADGVAIGDAGLVVVDGRPLPAVGMTTLHGDTGATLTDGRAPRADDEVALGAHTLDDLGASIGDVVTVTDDEGREHEVDVVGRVVFAGFGTYPGSDTTEPGFGALFTVEGLHDYSFDYVRTFLAVERAPGVTAIDTDHFGEFAELVEEGDLTIRSTPQRPADVTQVDRVRAIPVLLAALLGIAALAALVHALVVSVRQRRSDLAVLRSIGFDRRQVSHTVRWQATAVAATALVVGLPLGIAGGRVLWTVWARSLAVAPVAVTPLAVIVAAAAVTLVAANLVALWPARAAARTTTAAALRTE